MALIDCPDCGNKISDLARACIKCGRPIKAVDNAVPNTVAPSPTKTPQTTPPAASTSIMKWMIGLIIAAVAVKVLVDIDGKRQEGHPGTVVPTAAAPAKPTIKVDPDALLENYRKNEVATNDKLRGRIIVMTGTVEEISEMFGPIVGIQTGEKYHTIGAHLKDSERAAAAKLSKGDTVTVECASAMFVMDRPSLSDCDLK